MASFLEQLASAFPQQGGRSSGGIQDIIDAMVVNSAVKSGPPQQSQMMQAPQMRGGPVGGAPSGRTQMSISGGAPAQMPQPTPSGQAPLPMQSQVPQAAPTMPANLQQQLAGVAGQQAQLQSQLGGNWLQKFQARQKLPQLAQDTQMAQSNVDAWTAQQAANAQDGRYNVVKNLGVAAGLPQEQADAMARASATNDDVYKKYMDQVGEMVTADPETDKAKQIRERITHMKSNPEYFTQFTPREIQEFINTGSFRQNTSIVKNEEIPPEEKARNTWNALRGVENDIDQVKRSIDLVGPGTTGLVGHLMAMVPGTPAYDLSAMMDTQRAALAFEELLSMRRQSETGGALGNVSNREIELLYSRFAALAKSTSEEVTRESLMDVMVRFEKVKFMLENEQQFLDQGATVADWRAATNEHMKGVMSEWIPEGTFELLNDKENPLTKTERKKLNAKLGFNPEDYL